MMVGRKITNHSKKKRKSLSMCFFHFDQLKSIFETGFYSRKIILENGFLEKGISKRSYSRKWRSRIVHILESFIFSKIEIYNCGIMTALVGT